jgi:hypothetical protein
MGNPVSYAYLVIAIIDYAVKAVLHFRDTPQGQAEWLDVEQRYDEAFGDIDGAAVARDRAAEIRKSPVVSQTVQAVRTPAKINLNE